MKKLTCTAIILMSSVFFQLHATVTQEEEHKEFAKSLLSAVCEKDDERFATLLNQANDRGLSLSEVQNSRGNTLLHLAAERGDKDKIVVILPIVLEDDDGLQFINRNNKENLSALDLAVFNARRNRDTTFELASLLMENGATFDINSLLVAVLRTRLVSIESQRYIFNKIIDNTNNMRNFSKYWNAIVFLLMKSQFTDQEVLNILSVLVSDQYALGEVSSDWDKSGYFKGNLLGCAIGFDRTDPLLISFLLSNGVDPNEFERPIKPEYQRFDSIRCTPFQRACSRGNAQLVDILLRGGIHGGGLKADALLKDTYGNTPLERAKKRSKKTEAKALERQNVIDLLESHIASIKGQGSSCGSSGCQVQ